MALARATALLRGGPSTILLFIVTIKSYTGIEKSKFATPARVSTSSRRQAYARVWMG